MNSKRKSETEESLSKALEPPRKRQVARLDSILQDYIDPRDAAPQKSEPITPEHDARVVSDTTVERLTREVRRTTLVPSQAKPRHDASVEPDAGLVPATTLALHTIVDSEYTKTPNDLWDNLMPTLPVHDQAVLWQLYRLTRGYHRDTCTIGFPRLATRCNISPKQAQISVARLEKRGLIKRLGSDFGNRVIAERGNIYEVFLPEGREVQRARVARPTRVERDTRIEPDARMKENIESENTQTQVAGVGSRFSLEECRRYAESLQKAGKGINNPGGYATSIYRSGEADEQIAAFLSPPISKPVTCPLCASTGGYIYASGVIGQGPVKKCEHGEVE
jgi:DNA-binding Lrp family transcriptional regulator